MIITYTFFFAATTLNNQERPLTNNSGHKANYHAMGSGEMSPLRAMSPGLVFDTTGEDYLYFLCYYGYKDQVIRSLSGTNFRCPKNATTDLISNLNYPSISVARLGSNRAMTVFRTVTNVGPNNSTYTATIDAPTGLEVSVLPNRLFFAKRGVKISYQVKFSARNADKGYEFGSITWSDGAHSVRTVFAVNIV